MAFRLSVLARVGLLLAGCATVVTLTGCACNGDGDGDEDGTTTETTGVDESGTSDDGGDTGTESESEEEETGEPDPDVPMGMCSDGDAEPGEVCFAAPEVIFDDAGVASLLAANLNGAGAPDLVVGTEQGASVWYEGMDEGPELDTGGEAVLGIAVGDFDGAGGLDIALALPDVDEVRVYFEDGGGYTLLATIDTCMGPRALAAGDFVTGGADEIAVVCELDGVLEVYDGVALDQALSVGLAPVAVAAADLDDDGRVDLAVADIGSDTVSVIWGENGGFDEPVAYGVGSSPRSVELADVDGDDILDIAVANQGSADASVLWGTGQGFMEADTLITGAAPFFVISGDFDGDGERDLSTVDRADDTVSLFLSMGDRTFWPTSTLPTGQSPSVAAAADFNQDGVTDIAVGRVTADGGGLNLLLSDI